MRGLFFLCFLATSAPWVASLDCTAVAKCNNPKTDIRDLVICRVSKLFPAAGVTKVLKVITGQICNGTSLENIIGNFQSTAQSAADLSTYSALLSIVSPFTSCLKKYNSDMSTALSQCGTGFKNGLGTLFAQAKDALASFKGKCGTDDAFGALAKFACPKFTTDRVQSVIDATKAAMQASFQCAPDVLDPKLLLLSQYKGCAKSTGK